MNMIRAKGVPIVITIFAILVGCLSLFLGVQALFDGTTAVGYIEGADSLGVTWGGRNTALGVFLILAVILRNPSGYSIAFLGGIMREISDMMGMGFTVPLIIFTLIEAVCFVICLKAAWLNWQPIHTEPGANLFLTLLDYVRPIYLAGLMTVFALFIGLVGSFLGLSAMFDPTTAIGYIEGADILAIGWGGRNAALGLAMLLAVILRDSAGYAVAISGGILRELSDILVADGGVMPLVIFLLVEVAFFAVCFIAAWRTGRNHSSASVA